MVEVISERDTCSVLVDMHDWYQRYILAGINIFFALIASSGNTIIILSVLKSGTLRSQAPTYFIISLAIADLLVGAVVQPLYSIILIDWSTGTCMIEPYKLYIGYFTCSISISSAMFVCLDRMLKICFPFKYVTYVTNNRALFAVISIWMCGVGIGYMSVFFEEKKFIAFGTLAWIFNAILVGIYCSVKIYKVGCRQIKEINHNCVEGKKNIMRERKLAASLICVLAAVLFFWFPFVIVNVCVLFLYTSKNWFHFFVARAWTITFGYTNSSMNIFIFSFKNRDIKKAIRSFLRLKKRPRLNLSTNTVTSTCESPKHLEMNSITKRTYGSTGKLSINSIQPK